MMPLFRPDGDVVLVDKITPKLKRQYRRGDVVVAIPPNAPDKVVCKRIVGLVSETRFAGNSCRELLWFL